MKGRFGKRFKTATDEISQHTPVINDKTNQHLIEARETAGIFASNNHRIKSKRKNTRIKQENITTYILRNMKNNKNSRKT